MNKIVEQNRKAIVEASMNIVRDLTALVNMGVSNHQAKMDLTKSSDYSSEFVQGKIKQFDAQLHAGAEAYSPKLTAGLDIIEAAGRAMENAEVIIDAELSSALSIIESLQGVLPFGVEESLVSTFAGNQKALRIICGAIQRYGKKTTTLDKLLFEIEYKMPSLRGHVGLVTSDPYANGADIIGMRRDLINLCKVIGADVPEESFSLGDNYDALSDARFRKAAGLPAK